MPSARSWAKRVALAAGLATVMLGTAPAFAAVWVPGHYGPYGRWIPGHWAGGGPVVVVRPPVVVSPPVVVVPRRVWVPPHWAGGVWVAGHWAR